MKKAARELLVIVILFFATWYVAGQVNWMAAFKVEQAADTTEEKLGALYWKLFRNTQKELRSPAITKAVDSLVVYICHKNGVDPAKIKVHVLQQQEVNAFTLPDNYLVINAGLLAAAENEGELLGVLGHEIAHMEKNHVMKKLIKEVGLSVLLSMTTGNGGEVVKRTARVLSSSAYDRELEREADLTATDYLLKAGIDPEPFANFLYRLSDKQGPLPEQAYWVATHPDSKARAERIIAYIRDKKVGKKTVLSVAAWQRLKSHSSGAK